jgi:hypothetical protein
MSMLRAVSCAPTQPQRNSSFLPLHLPQAGRDLGYAVALPIKIANNPRARELACSGRGFTPRVDISPGVVDCGPVLPALPGQWPAEAALTLTNPTDRTVEVVCLDLDPRYREEQEALRALDMCGRAEGGGRGRKGEPGACRVRFGQHAAVKL